MTTLNRVVLRWQGPQIKGAAVSVLYFDGSDNAAPPVTGIQSAFQGLHFHLPSGVTIVVPASGDRIDDTTGALTGVWSVAGENTATMDGAAASAAGVGACVSWNTGGIVPGGGATPRPRRLRGRTFLVPLANSAYGPDGTLDTAAYNQINTFATALRAAGPLAVWHRPTSPGASDGNSYGVTSHRVSDKVAILTSRRD